MFSSVKSDECPLPENYRLKNSQPKQSFRTFGRKNLSEENIFSPNIETHNNNNVFRWEKLYTEISHA